MMKVHQFRMHEIEWSSYLLGFRTNIFLEADPDINVGDVIILSECIYVKPKETGRHLSFKIESVDLLAGVHDGIVFWNIELRRLKEYNLEKALKELGKENHV